MNERKHPDKNPYISIILPCLDEEGAISACLESIRGVIERQGLDAEVIVVDNGSVDRSTEIVQGAIPSFPGLRLVSEPHRGYGNALLRGLSEARGQYMYMADCDGSYDFADIPRFVSALESGAELVVGNRFSGMMDKGAMPFHRKYVGNPVLSRIVKAFFGVSIGDIHCGARAISREGLDRLPLHAGGMEFASEMIMKAARQGLSIAEIPVPYRARVGDSKLHSVRDGWRHIRFILLYSPLYFFFLPGMALFILGFGLMAILYFSTPIVFGIELFVHPMFFAAAMMILGYELIFFAFFAKIYAMTHLGEQNAAIERLFRLITIEKVGFLGLVLCLVSAFIYVSIFGRWLSSGFGSLDEIKNSVVALTLLVLGAQTFFSAFMLSIVGIRTRE